MKHRLFTLVIALVKLVVVTALIITIYGVIAKYLVLMSLGLEITFIQAVTGLTLVLTVKQFCNLFAQ